jgi:uncharacterized protein YndB with AHSA1/START domain
MNNLLLFNFEVDKSKKSIAISKEFSAEQSLVWETFTKKELLDQWWAPAPWTSKTTEMNFEVGGRRVYAMCSPDGEEHWAVQNFTVINAIANFKFEDAFADPNGIVNETLPSMLWSLDFSGKDTSSKVEISIQLKSLEHLEQIIQMGFKEGFTQTLTALDNLLSNLKK